MNVLITGSRGFVGTHFLRHFSQNPDQYVREIDLKKKKDCRDFFKKDSRPIGFWDLVIHLAAVVGGRQTIEADPIAVATDLSIDAEMFNWAVRKKPKRIIYYSSSAAYPIHFQEKDRAKKLVESDIDFERPAKPDFTYGWSKLTGEMLAHYATKQYGLNVSIFRPFSGYAEDQSLDYPFPSFIQRAKQRKNPFVIWGDGTQMRDFIHIDDVVSATLEAVKQEVTGPINIGWGRGTSFNELAEMIVKKVGYSPTFLHQKNQPIGVQYRVADNTKMLRFYQPKISLEEGIARALQK